MWALLALLAACGPGLRAQESYYGWNGQKMELRPDSLSTCVHLHPGASLRAEAWQLPAGVALLSEPRPQAERILLAHPAGEAARVLRAAGLADAETRSIAPGYRIAGGARAWLTHRLLYRPGAAFEAERFAGLLAAYPGAQPGQTPAGISFVEVPGLEQVIPLANALYESGMVEWSHPDFAVEVRAMGPPCLPSDSLFHRQYYLHNTGTSAFDYPYIFSVPDIDIDAPEAWCLSTGSPSITVAVIDEGVEAHEDLQDALGNSRVLPGYTASDPLNGVGAPEVLDDAHGQAVAGIIAASHNSIGVSGIAPQVKILPVHVFPDPGTPISHFADAINWAWQNGADILNNSWALDTPGVSIFPVIDQAIQDAATLGRGGKGCLVTFSTGQTAKPDKRVAYPGNHPLALAAGAIGLQGLKPGYARFGSAMDLVCPTSHDAVANVTIIDRMGASGYNPMPGVSLNYPNSNYSMWFGGTSVACAEVSGVAALALSVNPALTRSELFSLLTSTADDMGPAGFDTTFGWGRLNAFEAVQAAFSSTFPVEWLEVEAVAEEAGILLRWATAREENNAGFVVEKWDGQSFVDVGAQAGAGYSSEPQAYAWQDNFPRPGLNRYRIRQTDLDGRFQHSPQAEVRWPGAGSGISAPYPNPSKGSSEVQISGLRGQSLHFTLSDPLGRVLRQARFLATSDSEALSLPLEGLAPGIYLLRFSSGETALLSARLMLQR